VGDEIDFPSYLVTIEDADVSIHLKESSASAVPIEDTFVPRYNSRVGMCGTKIQSADSTVAPMKPARTHFNGLKKTKTSTLNFSETAFDECQFNEGPAEPRPRSFSITPKTQICGYGNFKDSRGSVLEDLCAAKVILPSKNSHSLETETMHPKRSARDILAIIGESDRSFADARNYKTSTELIIRKDEMSQSPLDDRLETKGSRSSYLESTATSEDWAPVAPASKKLRLGIKGSIHSQGLCAMSKTDSPRPRICGFAEGMDYDNPSCQSGKEMVNPPLPKRVFQRNTDSLNFPSAKECEESLTQRKVQIPATFSSWHQYSTTFTAAVYEEINLRVREMALSFYRVCQVDNEAYLNFCVVL
jgi:hypothetical protein